MGGKDELDGLLVRPASRCRYGRLQLNEVAGRLARGGTPNGLIEADTQRPAVDVEAAVRIQLRLGDD